MHEMNPPNVRWEWIGEGWQMFAEQWKVWVLQMLVVALVFAVPVVPFGLMISAVLAVTTPDHPLELPPLFLPLAFGIGLLGILGGSFFVSGFYRTAFKQLRGEQISVGDLFSGGDVFLRILGASIAIGLLAMAGTLLCILPGLVVPGLLFFTLPLIVERNLSVGEALSASYEATKLNWFMFALFAIVAGLLARFGATACCVGVLATYPLQFTIAAVAHRDMFGVAGARRFTGGNQPQYPTNYAPQSFSPPPQFGAPQQPEATTSICTNCGTMINRTSRFCSKCGSPIGA